MKIFHGPVNISGMAGILAREQKKAGADAVSYSVPNKYNYYTDRAFPTSDQPWDYLKFILGPALKFDVYQFYFGNSLTGQNLTEVRLLKALRKKVFFYFCGCDIRDSKSVIQTYQYSACKACWPMSCSANRKKATKIAESYANGVFVSTPDLLEFVDNSILLPQPIDIEILKKYIKIPSVKSNTIKIVHAPSNSQLKGSAFIEKAIENLIAKGYPIEFILIENKPHEEVLKICSQADIIIDQLLIGSYGQYSVEGMALGKPVVCYIRDDLKDLYPEKIPIVNANIADVEDVIKSLIDNDSLRESKGKESFDYVCNVHDVRVIAEKALSLYQS